MTGKGENPFWNNNVESDSRSKSGCSRWMDCLIAISHTLDSCTLLSSFLNNTHSSTTAPLGP